MFLETLRAGLAVEFFMGMALYAAIYLSFVRLLRFSRNWLSVSLSPAFTTAVLMIITAVYVSVSHVGFDPFALVASVGIIGVLFCIIAAPAIAFQPALRWVEFMAKHGNYAGLYIILPAGFAAYAVPNVKLLGLLSAVAVIEVVWFIRHRPNNRRPLKGPIMMDAPSQPQPRPPSIIDEGPNSPSANAVEAKESVDEASGSTLAEMADGLRNQIRNDQIRRLDKARKV